MDDEQITAAVPRERANEKVVFGDQNIDAHEIGKPSVIATCAFEAFIPDMSE